MHNRLKLSHKMLQTALDEALAQSVRQHEGKPDKLRKFDETIDVIINVRDVDIKNPNNRIDQDLLLPHGITGNNAKNLVCFIAKDDMEIKLKDLGYTVINPDRLNDLQASPNKDKKAIAHKYDYFVARADLMRDLARVLARFLGQTGKMPRPQPKGFGVIRPNEDIDEYIKRLDRIVPVRMKKQLLLQLKVGKKSQPKKDILENIDTVLQFVEQQLPYGYTNVDSIYIKTTMGKPAKVQ
jgi:large subunit ribosomal protein L1